ncbi:VWA domain-containing protein [Thiomicrorhabdus sp.]|uniref:VWA domain-containing protein n=1 Tax=Thiomicrorhabdus sp. TaxID=2039724 RepID=UPI003561BC46
MEIHFLRPWWFLALIPVVWLVWKAWHIKLQQGAWQKVIAPKFHKLLLNSQNQTQGLSSNRLAVIGLACLWIMAILALAGPSLKSVKLPAEKTHQGTVILLDLSLSMLAEDIKPNRISRARFKLIDLLKKHPETAFGLVAYAGTAHTIAPISEDNQTLLSLVPTLNPMMMPKYGSEPLLAMQQADLLFKGANVTQGHIVWVTDDLENEQRQAIADWIQSKGYSLSILAVGTQSGGAVNIPNYGLLKDDNGAIVLPKLPYAELEKLSRQSGAALTPLTVDETDLDRLMPNQLEAFAKQQAEHEKDKEVLHRLDDGTAVIMAMLPLLALAYRRGWLFSLSLLLLMPIGSLYSPPSYADTKLSDFADVFQTPDQQAYKAWKKQDYQAAESLFKSPQWKGSTLYRNGKYKEAAEQFKKDPSASGLYNLGNALAKQGQLKEAKQAYEQALQKQPDLKDAQSNLKLVDRILDQQQQTADQSMKSPQQSKSKDSQDQQTNSSSNQSSSGQQKKNGEQNRAENGSTSKQDQDKTAQSQGQSDNQQHDGTQKQSAKQQKQPPAADKEKSKEPSQSDGEQSDGKTAKESADSKQEKASQAQELADKSNDPNQPAESLKKTEQQQATENWLQQIPDQPGLFLKRKFEYQFQNQTNNAPDKPGEQATKKIW